MDPSHPQVAPPAHVAESALHHPHWKIRNTKYSSSFVTNGPPSVEDYRAHAKHVKDSFLECSPRAGSPAGGLDHVVDVQSSQAFSSIERLICEYQSVLNSIEPLNEEDVLFLLLSRYSRSSGASVYMEIKTPGDVQIFDSTIIEPPYISSIQDHMACAPSVITAEFPGPLFDSNWTEVPYVPIPQTPAAAEFDCSVALNFPEMFIVEPDANLPSTYEADCPPPYTKSLSQNDIVPVVEWTQLPAKLQPPAFRVHRCHHRGVERGGEREAFELPFGFPEIIQHMDTLPYHCYHIGFYLQNRTRHSVPLNEGGLQAFECYIVPSQTRVYITVERKGEMLVYDCYRDEEVWAQAHANHEDCAGCSDS